MILSLNHITLAVRDIDRSFRFYRDILGLAPLCRWDNGAYFLAGDFWFCLNVDSNVKPDHGYTHFAFSVTPSDFSNLSQRIIKSDALIFQQNESEGDSLYFLDPDGHKLEIHVGDWQSHIAAKKLDIGDWESVEWFV